MASTPELQRGKFGSRLGFVLAAAGSAIGLGNIWRFPYVAGENGGGAFVLVYLIFVAAIGLPVLLCEVALGRKTQRNPVGAFKAIVPEGWWPAVGGLGVLTGFVILSYYSVIAGWTLGYVFKAATGAFSGRINKAQSNQIFSSLIENPLLAMGLAVLFLLCTVLVVRGGVSHGIERAAKILMPVFFLLLVGLTVRSITLPGAREGIHFLMHTDFSKLSPGVIAAALGQALFSLSLGMGAMVTYGSYLPKKENLPVSAATVAGFDTLIALLGGFMIFPALFAAGVQPDAGPKLVFVVVPTIFNSMPMGGLFAVLFYFLLAIAALTSTISLLEVVTAYFVDERGWSREKAVWSIAAGTVVLAIPSALSFGAVGFFTTFIGKAGGFLDMLDMLFGNIALSLGALLISVFVGWRWGMRGALEEIRAGGGLPAPVLWSSMVRFLCPMAVVVVLSTRVYDYALKFLQTS